MRSLGMLLLVIGTVASVHAGIPTPSQEQMRHYSRELDHLDKAFRVRQRESGVDFGPQFWRDSKAVAMRNSPEIIAAIMFRARKWTDSEGLMFIPFVSLLPRKDALKILRAYKNSSIEGERIWANDYIMEFEADDVVDGIRDLSK